MSAVTCLEADGAIFRRAGQGPERRGGPRRPRGGHRNPPTRTRSSPSATPRTFPRPVQRAHPAGPRPGRGHARGEDRGGGERASSACPCRAVTRHQYPDLDHARVAVARPSTWCPASRSRTPSSPRWPSAVRRSWRPAGRRRQHLRANATIDHAGT
ncbi:hypothetical protein QJS66_21805 [Kocuria rhizophila]|nr:hypothetical protein QJS66_21805 [Kocuria rhizophila]